MLTSFSSSAEGEGEGLGPGRGRGKGRVLRGERDLRVTRFFLLLVTLSLCPPPPAAATPSLPRSLGVSLRPPALSPRPLPGLRPDPDPVP